MSKLIIGNWKMNGDIPLVDSFVDTIESEDFVLALPDVFISYAFSRRPKFKIGAQNCSIYRDIGAHTGEISAGILKSLGVTYIIFGHSERRSSSDLDSVDNIYKKLKNCLEINIIPILCVDENYEKLIDSKTETLLLENKGEIVIAYEPLSAIGTGVVPSITEIKTITSQIKNRYFDIKTLYGGSVNSNNSKDILQEVDGLLIGGTSLKLDELTKILKSQII